MRYLNRFSWQQILLFIVATLMWISVKSGQFLMRSQAESLTSDAKLVAAIFGISGLVGFLIRFPLGIFSDYIKYKSWIVKGSLGISVVAAGIYIYYPNPMVLYGYNLSMGVTICTWVLFNVLFSKESKTKQLTTSIGLLALSNNIGSFVAPIVTSQLVQVTLVEGKKVYDFSNRHTIWFAFIVGLLAFMLSFFISDKNYEATNKPTLKQTWQQIKDGKLWLLSIVGLVVTFMKYSTLKFSFETIVKANQLNPSIIGNIDAFYDVLHAIAGIVAGVYLIKWIGKQWTLTLGLIMMAACFIIAYVSQTSNIFLYANLFAGFGMGLTYITAMAMCIEKVPYEYKNTRMGLFQSIYMLGIFYAPQVCRYLESMYSFETIYLLNAIIGCLTCLLIISFRKHFK